MIYDILWKFYDYETELKSFTGIFMTWSFQKKKKWHSFVLKFSKTQCRVSLVVVVLLKQFNAL